jgi:hypothetical protein
VLDSIIPFTFRLVSSALLCVNYCNLANIFVSPSIEC